ncbi:MAG TPA: gluconokinase [Beijerinckiaceae bacterium]|nr:gluconokinase [Beijerinckiaceae bacterium]
MDIGVVLLMGVSGSGKSTTASLLHERLGWPFRDADSFHPPENIEKMSRGVPLDDADRLPWLHAIAAWIDERLAGGERGIVTCSALKRAYRDILVGGRTGVAVVHLRGDKPLIAGRLAARSDHFMPPALLDSQFAALEAPVPAEGVIEISVAAPPEAVADGIIRALKLEAAPQPTGR